MTIAGEFGASVGQSKVTGSKRVGAAREAPTGAGVLLGTSGVTAAVALKRVGSRRVTAAVQWL